MENWKKNLAVLSAGQFLYRAATRVLIPFLPFFIKEIGNSSFGDVAIWSGWIYSAPFIISFFTMPFWGSYGDRYGRKKIVLFAALGFSLSHVLMGFSNSVFALLIFSSLQEAFGGFYPASVSLVAANTPKEKNSYALGILQSSSAAGNIIGPALGGVIAVTSGYRAVFFIVAATVAFAAILIFFFVDEREFKEEKQKYFSTLQNLRYIFSEKILITGVLLLLFYSLGVTLLRPTFSLFIKSITSEPEKAAAVTGIVLSLFGGTAAISSAFVGNLAKKLSISLLITVSSLITAICFAIIPVLNSATTVSVVLSFCGLSIGIILPLINTSLSINSDEKRKAGVYGIGSSFSTFGNLFGGICAGYLVSNFGSRIPFVSSAVLFGVIAFISIVANANRK